MAYERAFEFLPVGHQVMDLDGSTDYTWVPASTYVVNKIVGQLTVTAGTCASADQIGVTIAGSTSTYSVKIDIDTGDAAGTDIEGTLQTGYSYPLKFAAGSTYHIKMVAAETPTVAGSILVKFYGDVVDG